MIDWSSERDVRIELERLFPGLVGTDYHISSPATGKYNCIAWAAGETHRAWWPRPGVYWPSSAPRQVTIQAFVEAFRVHGFEVNSNSGLEKGLEKIVIYAKQEEPTHAARQLPSGTWTSKLGTLVDIVHSLPAHVAGLEYGDPTCVMARPRRI